MTAREEDRARANARIPRATVGVQEKDEETIKLALQLAKALKMPEKPGERPTSLPEHLIKAKLYAQLPEPGFMLVEELLKVLYLNNQDPSKVFNICK